MKRTVLTLGALAGPCYVLVSLLEIVTRDGFDPLRQPWSALSLGDLGWIHVTNLAVAGLAVAAAATAFTGPVRILLSLYGLSLLGAAVFTVDPVGGATSIEGVLHFVCGAVGFPALTIAALVLARRFRAGGDPGWALVSALSGVFFFASFGVMASAGGAGWSLLLFTAGVIVIWAWFTAVCLRLLRSPAAAERAQAR